jgi:RimJ/RimL family protein N-acetyltransferase
VGNENTPFLLPDPALSDGEVVLRAWQSSDVEVVLAGGLDPVVSRFRYSLPGSPAGAREWIATMGADRASGCRLELAITDRKAALGSVSLTDFEHGNAMVRYWLLPEGRGRGLATRAVKLVATWAFSVLGIGRLAVFIEPESLPSVAVVERCGFVREGLLRRHMEGPDRQRVDSLIYGLLPEDLAR